MLKILPDSVDRLTRRLVNGPVDQRLKALQMTHDLGLAGVLRNTLVKLVDHANPKVRSKAVSVLANAPEGGGDAMLKRALQDPDPRVRASAVEVLDAMGKLQFAPLLLETAASGQNRERANAIKALHHMGIAKAGDALQTMLQDRRPDHRVSGLWAMRQMGYWKLLNEVGRLAKEDENMRVRRYALGVLKSVAEMMRERGKTA